jgi:hypothetical protein
MPRNMVIVFVGPVIFKATMLVALLWNAFDRPMQSSLPIRQALQRDGLQFYIVSASYCNVFPY